MHNPKASDTKIHNFSNDHHPAPQHGDLQHIISQYQNKVGIYNLFCQRRLQNGKSTNVQDVPPNNLHKKHLQINYKQQVNESSYKPCDVCLIPS